MIERVDYNEFIDIVSTQQYQNQDILEAMEDGFKGIQEAYEAAERPWARFYVFKQNKDVLATAMEQRDGVVLFFTTVKLPESNLRVFRKELMQLTDDIVACKDVIYIKVVSWHKAGQRLLRSVGFKPYTINNKYQIWIKENGK